MMSIVILAFREPRSVSILLKKIMEKEIGKNGILLVAPDEETLLIGRKYRIQVLKDPGMGKPHALNIAIEYLKSNFSPDETVIFMDGDIILRSFEPIEILSKAVERYKCVYALPKFLCFKEPYKTWAKFLERTSNLLKRIGKLNIISGNLWATKIKYLPEKIPENIFADDEYITLYFIKKLKITPKPVNTYFYIIFPSNLRDYIKQRIRTYAGHWQIKYIFGKATRELGGEFKYGIYFIFKSLYHGRIMEFLLNLLQGVIRILIWLNAKRYMTSNIKRVWVRIESSKI